MLRVSHHHCEYNFFHICCEGDAKSMSLPRGTFGSNFEFGPVVLCASKSTSIKDFNSGREKKGSSLKAKVERLQLSLADRQPRI